MEREASAAQSDLEQILVDESAEPKALPLSLLVKITDGFSEDQELGSGGFAVVYKGILGDRVVAVKKLSDALMDEAKFHREVVCLMQVKHKNVVRFLGYCADRQGNMEWYDGKLIMADVHKRLLCFEYIPNGSLDKYIIDARREWAICYKIIIGICEGLQYLHDNHIVHMDLKPANILLDDNMIAKITDFGLSRCFDKNQSRDVTKTILGTMGYMAPELRDRGIIACSTDMYSLGIIIIEVLTGQKGYMDIGDVLDSWSDRLEISQQDRLREQIQVCYEIALECIDFNPKKRPPSARNIIDRLPLVEIRTVDTASSISGVVATENKDKKDKGNADDPGRGAHPLSVAMPRTASTSPRLAVSPRPAGAAGQSGSAYGLVESKPSLPAKMGPRSAAAKLRSTYGYDMVEPMFYLYVSVVKARDLPTMDITDPVVEVKLGSFRGVTPHLEKVSADPVWRQTFAFSRAHIQSSVLEIVVKDKDMIRKDYIGRAIFDINEVPSRVPPDSPLAPQWYRLFDAEGNRPCGHHGFSEIMLSVWLGTQADEALPEAWYSDAHSLSHEGVANTRSKVYLSPKLMYLKVFVMAAQDLNLIADDKVIVKIQMGNQIRQTRPQGQGGTANPAWNEEFMFAATEPFDDPLVVTVEETGSDEPIGHVIIPLFGPNGPLRRNDNDMPKSVPSMWFTLSASEEEATTSIEENRDSPRAFPSKIQLRLSLEMAYQVLDLQPAAKRLHKSAIGVLAVGILSARGLGSNKNPYAVAKYGAKWVRTRTLLANAAPQWNEQYTWQVFDLSTVITMAVFDNANLQDGHGEDQSIGKVRVRLTTLESDRVYTHYHPLMGLNKTGGELHLALRFTCTAWADMLRQYGRPLLPKVHYTNPISELQLKYLRFQAMQLVVTRFGRTEPPLRREVVEYMLDVDSHTFSLQRSRANCARLTSLFSGVVGIYEGICRWKNPPATMLVHMMFVYMVCYPELVLPMVFLCMIMIGAWNYRRRPRMPSYMPPQAQEYLPPQNIHSVLQLDSVLWYLDQALSDENSTSDDIVKLRSIAGRVQTVVGDLAVLGERAQSLVRWHDPRVTPVFITLSLVLVVLLYLTPLRVVALVIGLYILRPPWFRSRTNQLFINLYTRLPSHEDVMLYC